MISARTVLLTAFSSMLLAAPAFAAPIGQRNTAIAPCDAEPLDGYYDPVALLAAESYFPDDEEALPEAGEQAAPDGDEAEPAEGEDEEAAPDGDGCANIMVAPYDFVVRPPESAPEPVMLRRRLRVTTGTRT